MMLSRACTTLASMGRGRSDQAPLRGHHQVPYRHAEVRPGKIVVELNSRPHKCGVIGPQFDVGIKVIEGWTARLVPSRQYSPMFRRGELRCIGATILDEYETSRIASPLPTSLC